MLSANIHVRVTKTRHSLVRRLVNYLQELNTVFLLTEVFLTQTSNLIAINAEPGEKQCQQSKIYLINRRKTKGVN